MIYWIKWQTRAVTAEEKNYTKQKKKAGNSDCNACIITSSYNTGIVSV